MRFLGLLLFTVGSFRSFDFLFLFRFLWHISPMLCHTINFHPNKSIENELIAADVAMQRKCAEAAMVMGKMEKKESIVALFKRNLTTWWPIYSFATVYLCVGIETSARHRYVHYFTAHDRHIANVTDKQTNIKHVLLPIDWQGAEEFPWIIYIYRWRVCGGMNRANFKNKRNQIKFIGGKVWLGIFKRCDQRTCAMN